MKEKELTKANETLQQPDQQSKNLLWVFLGVAVGIVFIVLVIVILWYRGAITGEGPGGSGSYPYIPAPKHTMRSTSIHELLSNLLLECSHLQLL